MQKVTAQLVSATVIGMLTAAPAWSGGTKALMLSQWEEIAGNHEVIACSNAVRLYSKKSETTLIAKAPDWKIYFFNTKKKVMHESNIKSWRCPFGIIMTFVAVDRFRKEKPKQIGVARIAGMPAVHLRAFVRDEQTRDGHLIRVDERPADYYVSDAKLNMPKQVCEISQRSFGMPEADGIPLMFTDKKGVGKRLTTSECNVAKVEDKIFAVPKNFRKVKDDSQVIFSPHDELINEFITSPP